MPPGEKKSCSEGSGWAAMVAVDKGKSDGKGGKIRVNAVETLSLYGALLVL